jgi:ribosomal protein S18 acetylase RimI-like enzyme
MEYAVDTLPAANLDVLEPLWLELLDHHLRQAPHLAALGPERTGADSWRLRREQYLQWLCAPLARIFVAPDSGQPLGYAMIRVIDAPGSWQWGDQVGVLETLVIHESARGSGAGSALLGAAREYLAGLGIQIMQISVLAGNDGALRFYYREGAVDFTQTLVMPVAAP